MTIWADLRDWLGKERLQALVGILIATGIASTALQVSFPNADWLAGTQTLLVVLFLASALFIVSGVLSPVRQKRLAFMVLPSLVAVGLGIFLPSLFRFFLGAALGWLLVSQMMLRDVENREYKLAVKALRKSDYKRAIELMSDLIAREATEAEHYGFRAQLYRLNNQVELAKRDYEQALKLDAQSALGANGLAEIFLQENNLAEARHWADQAHHTAPQDWVTGYNLGMIAERQGDDKTALQALNHALKLTIPDSRHRLLAYVWLIRIYVRQHKTSEAKRQLTALQAEKKGLHEWEVILDSEESAYLRQIFQQDVRAAQALMGGQSLNDVFSVA